MEHFIDYNFKSINKFGEELCGDNVEIIKKDDGVIVVLADGLGSGVKASILATLTSKIAVTMLKEGLSIEETINTITNTLPVCQKRHLAYSTFTIVDMKNDGQIYMIEYENPASFVFRRGKTFQIVKNEKQVNQKKIIESHFQMRQGDSLVIVSDGVIHAGVGELLNLGWQWENVKEFLEDLVKVKKDSKSITDNLIDVCRTLYNERAGDDTTVCSLTLRERVYSNLFVGPPKNPVDDIILLEKFKNAKGYKLISGGTTANIIAKGIKEDLVVDLESYDKKIPPMAKLKGADLVTEGLLTLNKVVESLRKNEDGDSPPVKELITYLKMATNIKIWLGKAINSAHQNPNLPEEFNLKAKVVYELKSLLEQMDKVIEIKEL